MVVQGSQSKLPRQGHSLSWTCQLVHPFSALEIPTGMSADVSECGHPRALDSQQTDLHQAESRADMHV